MKLQGYSSYYLPDGPVSFRFFRWFANDFQAYCSVAELQYHGILLSDALANTPCNASVKVGP
jgi:hypothetical protein